MNGDETLQQFFMRFDILVRQIRAAGSTIDLLDEICHLFLSLPSKFDTVVTALTTVSEDRLTMDYVKSRLIEEELKTSDTSSVPNFDNSNSSTFYASHNEISNFNDTATTEIYTE